MKILVTGAAGFIGFHLSRKILESGISVIAIDNLNSYYDPVLKEARLNQLKNISKNSGVELIIEKCDITEKDKIDKIFESYKPQKVVNLAAQAGVRYSLENPKAYIQTNIVGFLNILEGCRNFGIEHLVYASSSSVYGGNTNTPFSEKQSVDHPVSLYAATKKSNELMAHTYSHLYDIPTTGLRFFTVYGPWGRPDMALFLFTKAILNDQPIKVFNHGKMIRDFTYIDDIIESVMKIIKKPSISDKFFNTKSPNPSSSWAPYRVFNIGNSTPTSLLEYIDAIENEIGKKSKRLFLPMQPGDVPETESDTSLLESWIGFKPNTSIKNGVKQFITWYRDFYKI